ncbi:MAG: Trm112 family protein [Candidatus Aenigmatarchaeota archaeon]|nr:Trm112 family protein [Candidatus Aenigmarchaeota archaeon]
MLDKELLEILVCPKCKGKLIYNEEENFLICIKDKLKFKILEGDIPDMLLEDAEPL